MTDTDELFSEIKSEIEASPPAEDTLVVIHNKALEITSIEEEINALDSQRALLVERRDKISRRDMLDLMDNAKIPYLASNGYEFVVEEYIKAAIPKDMRDEAHAWLEDEGEGDLIKYTIEIVMSKESHAESNLIMDVLHLMRTQGVTEEGIYAIIEKLEAHQKLRGGPKASELRVNNTADRKREVPWARLTSWYKEVRDDEDYSERFTDKVKAFLGIDEYRFVKFKPIEEKKPKKTTRRK